MFGIRLRWCFLMCLAGLLHPSAAFAGMPSVTFTEVARLRMEVVSFFAVGLLLSAGAVQLIWHWLRKDFAWLPQLGYFRSLLVVTLWGLMFVVVLTMISGARELMTPGAWVKKGATYQLRESDKGLPPAAAAQAGAQQIAARSRQLLALGNALRQWAEKHDGKMPTAEQAEKDIASSLWDLPELAGTRYLYVAGATLADSKRVIAYEPQLYGDEALAINVNGELLQLPFEELLARVRKERAVESAPATEAAEVSP